MLISSWRGLLISQLKNSKRSSKGYTVVSFSRETMLADAKPEVCVIVVNFLLLVLFMSYGISFTFTFLARDSSRRW